MRSTGSVKRIALGLAATLLLAASMFGGDPALATGSVYGRGNYGNCGYQTACPAASPSATPAEPTIGTTPSGLKFAVNLTNGQVMPRGQYTVMVTPIGNATQTISRVEFFVDGQSVFVTQPNETGTAIWKWDTVALPGTDIKVVVTDASNTSATQEFHVTIASATTAPSPATGAIARIGTIVSQLVDLAGRLTGGVARAVVQIPVPAAIGFPYLLFALLGGILLLLVAQARREVAQAETLQAALKRERLIAEEKMTFVHLISHYLRTPLTLLQSALDLAAATNPASRPASQQLRGPVDSLKQAAEGLIGRIDADASLAGIQEPPSEHANLRIWTSPAIVLPFVLLMFATIFFNILLIHAGQITAAAVNFVIQITVGALLGLALYQLLRARQLRRAQQRQTNRILEHQSTVDAARTAFIQEANQLLAPRVQAVVAAVPSLGPSKAAELMRQACAQYTQLLRAMKIAVLLQSGQSRAPFQPALLSTVLQQASGPSEAAAAAKPVTIGLAQDVALASQHPKWLAYVLASLLDNAVAYSPPRGTVTVAAATQPQAKTAVITVADAGAGIAPDKLAQLFQPFYKAEGALDFTHAGAGLSLYLDKLIMSYLGGTIRAESSPGHGAKFTMTFPTSF